MPRFESKWGVVAESRMTVELFAACALHYGELVRDHHDTPYERQRFLDAITALNDDSYSYLRALVRTRA